MLSTALTDRFGRRALCFIIVIALTALGLGPAGADTVRNDLSVASSVEPEATLYIRERLPAGSEPEALGKAVLFVHGATYPGVTFDMEIPGYGWMGSAAKQGFAAYYLDVRGYGNSTRPVAMDADPKQHPPFSRATDAVNDIADAVNFILARTGADKISLVGWSWGTVTAGMFAAQHPDRVERLVQYAPVYSHKVPAWTERLADPDNPDQLSQVGAFRTVTADQARERWENQITPEDKSQWRDEAVLTAWIDAMLADEPGEVIRAPNGVLVDLWEIFHARPIYDAADIQAPTLVIRGSADPTSTRADALGLYDALGAAQKQYVEIASATHFASLERPAPQLISAVQAFLNGELINQ